MKDILQTICNRTLERVRANETFRPEGAIKELIRPYEKPYAFSEALRRCAFGVIAEIKQASPSKGIIDEKFDYLSIARDYEEGGAAAISCLTEPYFFLGSDKIFAEIKGLVSIPMLRKDFILTPYQVYESAALKADCILLIMAALEVGEAEKLFKIADSLGMDVLFECRTEEHIKASLGMGARIIGVNNRNLSDFSVDNTKASRMRELAGDRLFISESGIMSQSDAAAQRAAGVNGILVGEYLMRARDRKGALRGLLNGQS